MSDHQAGGYYVPEPSSWPIVGSAAIALLTSGLVMWANHISPGGWLMLAGLLVLFYMMFGWFGTVIAESQSGKYNQQVDLSYRWGMSWFIFSEVMFFGAFFGARFICQIPAEVVSAIRASAATVGSQKGRRRALMRCMARRAAFRYTAPIPAGD